MPSGKSQKPGKTLAGVFGVLAVVGVLYAFTQPYSQRIDDLQERLVDLERRLATHAALQHHNGATGKFATLHTEVGNLKIEVSSLRNRLQNFELKTSVDVATMGEKVRQLEGNHGG